MRYRDCVCAVICRNGDTKVLVCHRSGFDQDSGWQFPQGGVDTGADLIGELKRELREEIGTDDITVLRTSHKTYTYDFPESARKEKPGFDGQRQRWVLVRLNGDEGGIGFKHQPAEFDGFEWVEPREAVGRVVEFKRGVYTAALRELGLLRHTDRPLKGSGSGGD